MLIALSPRQLQPIASAWLSENVWTPWNFTVCHQREFSNFCIWNGIKRQINYESTKIPDNQTISIISIIWREFTKRGRGRTFGYRNDNAMYKNISRYCNTIHKKKKKHLEAKEKNEKGDVKYIRPFSNSHGWTGSSMKWRLMQANLFKCKLICPH